jgi:hypothetical protein
VCVCVCVCACVCCVHAVLCKCVECASSFVIACVSAHARRRANSGIPHSVYVRDETLFSVPVDVCLTLGAIAACVWVSLVACCSLCCRGIAIVNKKLKHD